jgi:hypothetical protein
VSSSLGQGAEPQRPGLHRTHRSPCAQGMRDWATGAPVLLCRPLRSTRSCRRTRGCDTRDALPHALGASHPSSAPRLPFRAPPAAIHAPVRASPSHVTMSAAPAAPRRAVPEHGLRALRPCAQRCAGSAVNGAPGHARHRTMPGDTGAKQGGAVAQRSRCAATGPCPGTGPPVPQGVQAPATLWTFPSSCGAACQTV